MVGAFIMCLLCERERKRQRDRESACVCVCLCCVKKRSIVCVFGWVCFFLLLSLPVYMHVYIHMCGVCALLCMFLLH